MITRAQIRRQLRKEGGIMNAVPRQKYGIGSWLKETTRKIIPKEVAKAAVVAAPFVAPFNPAIAAGMAGLGSFQQTGRIGPSVGRGLAMYGLGQGARYLGGAGPQWGLKTPGAGTGFKSYFSSPLSASRSASLFGTPQGSIGPSLHGTGEVAEATKGILGKLGLTKGGGSMKMTPLGMISGASLLTYFMQKGKTEEEAEDLAQDVYRGKGLGLDLIKADIKKYRTGDLSGSQMFDRGYHFLTPRDYVGAAGGRVKYGQGSGEGVEQMYVSDEAGALPKSEGGVLPKDVGKLSVDDFDDIEDYRRYIKYLNKNKKAEGGRIGLYAGGNGTPLPEDPTKPINPWAPRPKEGIKSLEAGASSIKVKGDVRPENMKMAKNISRRRLLEIYNDSEIEREMGPGSSYTTDELHEILLKLHGDMIYMAQGGRIGYSNGSDYDPEDDRDIMEIMRDEYGTWDQHDADYYSKLKKKKSKKKYKRAKAFGGGIGAGMPRIPMGMPRVNAGGIRELDYRQSGGFVPMGVKEKADDVPAMLSKNEFVMTADAVKGAGGGSVEKGAQKMYDTMKRLEGRVV